MTSFDGEVSGHSNSNEFLNDGSFTITRSSLVEPMSIDDSVQLFTQVPPQGLQGTVLTIKETKQEKPVFEPYLTSKVTQGKSILNTHSFSNQLPGVSSGQKQFQQRVSLSGAIEVPRKSLLSTSSHVESQQSHVGLLTTPRGAGLPGRKSRPASVTVVAKDPTAQCRTPSSGVMTLIGQPRPVLAEGSLTSDQIILSDGCFNVPVGSSVLKVPIPAASQPRKPKSSNMAKISGVESSNTPGKSGRTPNIFSRNRIIQKSSSSNALQATSLAMTSANASAVLAPSILQMAMPLATTVASPRASSAMIRPFISNSSQNVVILNSPAVGGRVIRLAGNKNFSLAPVATIALPSSSLQPETGAKRIPTSRASVVGLPRVGSPTHRIIVSAAAATTTQAQLMSPAPKTASSLTSFRLPSSLNPKALTRMTAPQIAKEPERLHLKRLASWPPQDGSFSSNNQLDVSRKKRKFFPGKVYHIDLPDGKKLTGLWENNMLRRHASEISIVDTGALSGSVANKSEQVNTGEACSATGKEIGQVSLSVDYKAKSKEVFTEGQDNGQLYLCLTCKTLSYQNTPCNTCSAVPQACLLMTTENNSARKALATTPNSNTSTDVSTQQLTQQKVLRRVIMVQTAAKSKQIQVIKQPLDQNTASSNLGLTLPLDFTGNARTSATRLVRRKTLETQKRTEPDVVQILSSDDEESAQKESSNSQTGAIPSTNLSIVPALSGPNSEEREQIPLEQTSRNTMGPPATSAAPAIAPIENLLFTIKVRVVRFGTLQRNTVSESSFYTDGIKIAFSKDEIIDSSSLYIPVTDLRAIRVHCGPCGPVFFLHTHIGVGSKLRDIFKMSLHGQIFDPDHRDDACRFITIVPDKNQTVDDIMLKLSKMRSSCSVGRQFSVEFITGEVASQLLKARVSVTMAPPATPTQTVIFITASGQIIQRQIIPGELVGQSILARPTEGDEEEEVADRSRSPSPPRSTFVGPIVRLFTYPPPPATGGITVANEDFFCLKDGEFLNDVIIDFYLKYLLREVLGKDDRERTHVFSSFFYRRLMQKQAKEHKDELTMTLQQLRHSRVKTWTRHVDLFAKDFIIVPINESAHWYLAIICFPGFGGINSEEGPENNSTTSTGEQTEPAVGNTAMEMEENKSVTEDNRNQLSSDKPATKKQPCILIFDSLAVTSRYGVVRTLREYLQCEWDAKKKVKEGPRNFTKDNMQGACPRCPRQTNFSDCGVYLLQYVESFFKDPISDFQLPINSLANWFSEEAIVCKRESLRQLVLSLQKSLNPDLDFDPLQNLVESTMETYSGIQLMSESEADITRDLPTTTSDHDAQKSENKELKKCDSSDAFSESYVNGDSDSEMRHYKAPTSDPEFPVNLVSHQSPIANEDCSEECVPEVNANILTTCRSDDREAQGSEDLMSDVNGASMDCTGLSELQIDDSGDVAQDVDIAETSSKCLPILPLSSVEIPKKNLTYASAFSSWVMKNESIPDTEELKSNKEDFSTDDRELEKKSDHQCSQGSDVSTGEASSNLDSGLSLTFANPRTVQTLPKDIQDHKADDSSVEHGTHDSSTKYDTNEIDSVLEKEHLSLEMSQA